MQSYRSKLYTLLSLVSVASMLSLAGCGGGGNPNVATVSGTITYMGKPVTQATVSFHPTSGRGSVGKTDDEGHYSLNYIRTQKGALIGEHKVTITTDLAPQEDRLTGDYSDNNEAAQKGRAEFLPAKYSRLKDTVLTKTVAKGDNTIDFNLEK